MSFHTRKPPKNLLLADVIKEDIEDEKEEEISLVDASQSDYQLVECQATSDIVDQILRNEFEPETTQIPMEYKTLNRKPKKYKIKRQQNVTKKKKKSRLVRLDRTCVEIFDARKHLSAPRTAETLPRTFKSASLKSCSTYTRVVEGVFIDGYPVLDLYWPRVLLPPVHGVRNSRLTLNGNPNSSIVDKESIKTNVSGMEYDCDTNNEDLSLSTVNPQPESEEVTLAVVEPVYSFEAEASTNVKDWLVFMNEEVSLVLNCVDDTGTEKQLIDEKEEDESSEFECGVISVSISQSDESSHPCVIVSHKRISDDI